MPDFSIFLLKAALRGNTVMRGWGLEIDLTVDSPYHTAAATPNTASTRKARAASRAAAEVHAQTHAQVGEDEAKYLTWCVPVTASLPSLSLSLSRSLSRSLTISVFLCPFNVLP